jgi:predicted DCC family thiol-disulfide oxidoreductase YuxK
VSPSPILFFDGVCSLCNASVDWLMRRDRRGVLRFASLQGETARARLPEDARDTGADGSLVLLLPDGRLLRRSDAVLEAARLLGWPWKIALVAKVLPGSWRDLPYRFIARRRYRWFGQRASCRLPSPAERGRLLD